MTGWPAKAPLPSPGADTVLGYWTPSSHFLTLWRGLWLSQADSSSPPCSIPLPSNDCGKVTEKALTSRQAQNLKETGTRTCFLAFFCQSYRMDIQVRSATTWLRKIIAIEQWGKLERKLRQMNEHSEWAPHLCIHCLRLQGISSGRKLGHGYLLLKV